MSKRNGVKVAAGFAAFAIGAPYRLAPHRTLPHRPRHDRPGGHAMTDTPADAPLLMKCGHWATGIMRNGPRDGARVCVTCVGRSPDALLPASEGAVS